MCKIYDFEEAKLRAQEKALATPTSKAQKLKDKIIDTALSGVSLLIEWEHTNSDDAFRKAIKKYERVQSLMTKMEAVEA